MASNDNEMLGVVLIVRHGDRQGFYQSPTTYTATATQITPLGNVRYLEPKARPPLTHARYKNFSWASSYNRST